MFKLFLSFMLFLVSSTSVLVQEAPVLAQEAIVSKSPHHAGHMKFHNQFYKHLKQPNSEVSCCDNKDCRPARHRMTKNGHEFHIGGRWLTVDRTKLINTVTPDGGGHWCGLYEYAHTITFCGIVPFQAF